MVYLYSKVKKTEKAAQKFEVLGNGEYSVLFIGDRTVFSLGLEDVKDSLPGQISGFLKNGKVIVDGRPDLRIDELSEILSGHVQDTPDVIVISIGENDILKLRNPKFQGEHIRKTLDIANELSDYSVVLLGPRNLGEIPIMPPVLSGKYKALSKDYNDLFEQIAVEKNVEFVRGPRLSEGDSSVRSFFTEDEFHYNKNGFENWARTTLRISRKLGAFYN